MRKMFQQQVPELLEQLEVVSSDELRSALNSLNDSAVDLSANQSRSLLLDMRLLHLSATGRQFLLDLLFGNFKPVF